MDQQCKMNYGQAIKHSMEKLAEDSRTVFVGYNLSHGSQAYGSLSNVPKERILEMPVAENLMAGMSMGMSIEGFLPVVIFERHDFMLLALDALVNHLDKIEELSQGQYIPKAIIRAIIGSKKPINPGPQHSADFTQQFRGMLHFPIYDPINAQEVLEAYEAARVSQRPSMFIERRELYGVK